jgi:hypothetical protein
MSQLHGFLDRATINESDLGVIHQAADTLESFSHELKIDAAAEVQGMRSIFQIEAANKVGTVLQDAQQALAHAIYVMSDKGTFSSSIALKGTEARVKDAIASLSFSGFASSKSASDEAKQRLRREVIGRYVADHGYFVQQSEPGAAVFVVAPESHAYRYIARMDEGTEAEQLANAAVIKDALNAAMVAKFSSTDVDTIIAYYARCDEVDAKLNARVGREDALPAPALAMAGPRVR